VSHDLRTPLATIKVASSTLSSRANVLSTADAHELHELIEIEADRLTRLVTNLLDMTRIEAGVLEIQQVPTSLNEMVKEAINVMSSSLKDRQLRLEVSDSLPQANIDRLLVIQVLVNLLDNALRHSPAQGVITVSAEQRGSSLVLSVADQGAGVAAEDREAIFNRFEQFNTGGRAGLGSPLRRLSSKHTARGSGTRTQPVAVHASRFRYPPLTQRQGWADVARVLVVDDDRSLLRALRLGLQSEGHEVTTAETGEQGLSQTALLAPDVVVLDIGLPDIDGLTVCRRIRQWSDVPIIILSATGDENRKIAALDGGANDYVTKPFSMGELEARIRVVVRTRVVEPPRASLRYVAAISKST